MPWGNRSVSTPTRSPPTASRESGRFPLETIQALLAGGQIGRQDFECNLAVQGSILGPIHLTHPALAELLHDLEVRKGLTDHGALSLAKFLK